MPKFTLIADSTQLVTASQCPQKWLNHDVKHIEPVKFETEEAMSAGTYGHRLMDIYYRARVNHVPYKDSMELVYAYDPDKDMCVCGCPKDLHQHVEALGIDECKRCRKCLEFRPVPFPLDSKDRVKIQRRFNEYTQKYLKDDFMPLSENHVEVGFSNTIFEDDENRFILEGRIDLIAKWQGLDVCFVDHKFQGVTTWLYPKNIQFKDYALATGITTGVINYVRLVDTKTLKKDKLDTVLIREIVQFNQFEIAAWQKRVIEIFFKMKRTILAHQAKNGAGVERNWASCAGEWKTFDKNKPKYCWYNPLCEEIDKNIADRKEKTLFKINENPWRPW